MVEGNLFMKGFRISGHKICILGEASGFFLIDLTTSGTTFFRGGRSWGRWAKPIVCIGGRGMTAFLRQPNTNNSKNRNRSSDLYSEFAMC